MNNHFSIRFLAVFLFFHLAGLILLPPSYAAILIEAEDPQFHVNVSKELQMMREGKRGLVSQSLVEMLDIGPSTTTIRPITTEEDTWHPNDRKGTRGHVVAVDTKIRGAERTTPTAAVLYIHPNRIDPSLSVYRLGTFPYELATAKDLNYGYFFADYKIREKRAVFYRNAWCDSLGYGLIEMSGHVPTKEYQIAKKKGLIRQENKNIFPIIEIPEVNTSEENSPLQFERP